MQDNAPVVVIGAGPAGLTAALLLTRQGREVVVVESGGAVGGLNRTVEHDGWRIELGGHGFATKSDEVERLWRSILPDETFPERPWRSRVLRGGELLDGPPPAAAEVRYPVRGAGMMWQRARELVERGGGRVLLNSPATRIELDDGRAVAVGVQIDGGPDYLPCAAVISSMRLGDLVRATRPPAAVGAVADGLSYRGLVTVALVVAGDDGFPENTVYVDTPDARVARVQNFRSWSPTLVRPGYTCLGMEYVLDEGDDLWSARDGHLIDLARTEARSLGLVRGAIGETAYVVRVPGAYPVCDAACEERVDLLRGWLSEHAPNVQTVGRKGTHRDAAQDESMLTAMRAVERLGASGRFAPCAAAA